MTRIVHSYSSLKQFEQCPKQFHEVRVLKRYKQEDTDATRYGTAVHKAIEDYIMLGTPFPTEFAKFQPVVDQVLAKTKGERTCEAKLGLDDLGHTRDFFAEDAFLRGVPDLMVVNEPKKVAYIVDWKTGKSSKYADPEQLELMAVIAMCHNLAIETVRCALVFLVANDIVTADYNRGQLPALLAKWHRRGYDVQKLVDAGGPWNARPNSLCRFCPVTSCPHHPNSE